jgi:hypothetical protein
MLQHTHTTIREKILQHTHVTIRENLLHPHLNGQHAHMDVCHVETVTLYDFGG